MFKLREDVIKLMFKRNYILLLILLVGFLLRFINLDSNPPSMHADEADTGYTALTLIKTGMDPYGNFLPLHFQAQSDVYRAPLYTYITVPFVFFFGLSEVTTRIASVLLGVVFIVLIYLLAYKIFSKRSIALIAALLAAINPWSILLSRTGTEVNACIVILTGAITAFFYHEKSKWMFLLSSFLFGLSIFTYHAAKIAAPLIIIVLIGFYWKKLIKHKKIFAASALVFTVMYIGMLSLATFSKGAAEFNKISIFDNQKAAKVVGEQRTRTLAPLSLSSVFSNKGVYYFREMGNTFVGPMSVNFLFVNGENALDKGFANYGQFHLVEFLFVVVGLYMGYRTKKKIFYLLVLIFLIGLLPATITNNIHFAYRDIVIMPIIILFSALGLYHFYLYNRKRKLILLGIFVVFVTTFSFFLYNMFFAYPYYARDGWGYSQKEALSYIKNNIKDDVGIDGGLDWAILYAFYNKIEPEKFQKAYEDRIIIDDSKIFKIDNLYIGNIIYTSNGLSYKINFSEDPIIIAPSSILKEYEVEKVFYAPDGGSNYSLYHEKN